MATIDEIKEAVPEPNDKIKVIANELDRLKGLKRLINSDGGKELVAALRGNCSLALQELLIASRRENPNLIEILSIIAQYSANLDVLSKLKESTGIEEIDAALVAAVKEFAE